MTEFIRLISFHQLETLRVPALISALDQRAKVHGSGTTDLTIRFTVTICEEYQCVRNIMGIFSSETQVLVRVEIGKSGPVMCWACLPKVSRYALLIKAMKMLSKFCDIKT